MGGMLTTVPEAGVFSGFAGCTGYSGVQGYITTASSGVSNHTFTTASTGSGTAFDNRPAYATIVLCKKD